MDKAIFNTEHPLRLGRTYPWMGCAHYFVIGLLLTWLSGCSMGSRLLAPVKGDSSPSGEYAQGIVTEAHKMLGAPYRYGGASPKGFDCSGLVQYVYAQSGLKVPRSTIEQMEQSKWVSFSQLRPGDLVFFKIGRSKVNHVGIYYGDGRFIHAPNRGKDVSFAQIESDYWAKRMVAAGRFY